MKVRGVVEGWSSIRYGLSHIGECPPALTCSSITKCANTTYQCVFEKSKIYSTSLRDKRFYSGKMASPEGEQHEWSAVRVRNTFLDYFKKNGHTFGACPIFQIHQTQESSSLTGGCNSAVVPSRSPLRSNPSVYECGHEPVQINLPRHSRPSV